MTVRSLACVVVLAAASTVVAARQQRPTFRSTSSGVLVNAFVLAGGTKGPTPIDGLTGADFQLLDNGEKETVDATPARGPIDLTLVVDGGGDAVKYYATFRQMVHDIALNLHPTDRVRLLVCSGVVREAVPLQPASSPIAVDAIGQPDAPYGPALVHGLFDAMTHEVDPDRREIVIGLGTFTGRDIFSPTALVSVASTTDAVVYLAVEPTGTPVFPEVFRALGQIVSTTGGALMLKTDSGSRTGVPPTFGLRSAYGVVTGSAVLVGFKNLTQVIAMVLQDLRHGYVLSYSPPGGTTPGWHTITVRVVKPGLWAPIVRARKRYYASEARGTGVFSTDPGFQEPGVRMSADKPLRVKVTRSGLPGSVEKTPVPFVP